MLAGAYSRGGTRKFQRCLFCSIARRGPCGGTGTEFGCRRSLAMINTAAIALAQGQAASDLALANSGAADIATPYQQEMGHSCPHLIRNVTSQNPYAKGFSVSSSLEQVSVPHRI